MTFKHEARHPQQDWIVVADRCRAAFYQTQSPDLHDLKEVRSLIHAEGGCLAHEVQTDRPGRFPTGGGKCSSGEPETDFRHQSAQEFACQIAAELDRGRTHHEFNRVTIVAPALLLGTLRKHLSAALKKHVAGEIDKDLMHLPLAELAKHLRQALATTET
jgi:protein required for attachment to host cells